MPRTIQVSVPPHKAEEILERVAGTEGVFGLARHCGASVRPHGDIVEIQSTNDATRTVMALLTEMEGLDTALIRTTAPKSIFSSGDRDEIEGESSETVWEEIESLLRDDTNPTYNFFILTFLSGAVCAAGLWADSVDLVIASMLIAPMFEPLVRISLGAVAGPARIISGGLVSAATGYLLLILGALSTGALLRVLDAPLPSPLESLRWVQHWSTFGATGLLSSVFASAAGTIIVIGQRSVLTTGVMIALALIPAMTIAALALEAGNLHLAAQAFMRWAVDVAIVMIVSAVVLYLKQHFRQRRRVG